ncbi:MAG: TetR/AcrR family transcriptional regulator [Hyphomicrobiales bacterium]
MPSSSMRDVILDAAEKRIRAVGYNAVSFRELATDVGVKSASIHYHFPQKSDLGVELVTRYSTRFHERLEEIDTSEIRPALEAFLSLYSAALVLGNSVCLCAILGAEANGLPSDINDKIKAFFELNAAWLSALFERHNVLMDKYPPLEILASLEGSMIIASSLQDRSVLDGTIRRILNVF